MKRILLVKTSSLGDVVHALPLATDLARAIPGLYLDWVVEEAFAAVPRLHPAIGRVIPVAIRRWRRSPLDRRTHWEVAEFRRRIGEDEYDMIIDAQGLLKSALVALFARGRKRCGFDFASVRERAAAFVYGFRCEVPRAQHAIERNRQLGACCAGARPLGPLDYGLSLPPPPEWLPPNAVAFLHASSRADKSWPPEHWIALGRHLASSGHAIILPWGSDSEKQAAYLIASAIGDAALVPPTLGLDTLAAIFGACKGVVGVDTGLSHLAAAAGAPVVALFGPTHPHLTGVVAEGAANLGGGGQFPEFSEVLEHVEAMLP